MGNSIYLKFFLPVTILLIALVPRVFFLDLIEFKYDEAFTVFELERFYSSPYLMQVGPPQSTGIYNPPFFNYIMVFLALFSRHPQYLSFLIGLINAIFVLIFYFVTKRFYGRLTATFSSVLLATLPWNIVFSRKIWIPDLLLPFIISFLYFAQDVFLKKSQKAILPMFIILALLSQMHASGGFFTLATIIILLVLRIKVSIKNALAGFSLGLIPAIPYFIRQLTSTPFCIDCVSFFNYQSNTRNFDINNFTRPFQLISNLNFQVLLGDDYPVFIKSLSGDLLNNLLFGITTVIFIIGVFIVFKYQKQFLFLLFYIFIIPSLYFFSKTPSYMHYFIIISPIMILVLAITLNYFFQKFKNSYFKAGVIILFIALISINIIFQTLFFQFIALKQKIKGDFGPIFPITQRYIEDQTKNYFLLPFYNELKSYAYMFAQTKFLHQKLGEYFTQKQYYPLAIEEYKKAVSENNQDKYSHANLALIYMRLGNHQEALDEISILNQQDATLAGKLQDIYNQIQQNNEMLSQ